MSEAFQLQERDGGIAVLTFDLPQKKVNTLGRAVLAELAKWIGELSKRGDLRGLSGSGRDCRRRERFPG